MKTLLRFCFMGLLSVVLLAGCGGGGGGGGSTGGDTTGAPSVVTKAYAAVSMTICPSGGIQVDAGIDDNKNGVLDTTEVDSTQYVCNGTNGSNGLSALVSVTTESAGANCANGGNKVSVGPDANGNGVLDTAEITSSNYICTGANGTNGTNGANGTNGTNGTNGNTAPVANAGPDQKVAATGVPVTVTLTGSGSADANGNTLTYTWSYTSKPVGSAATLSSSTVVGPTFTADKAGTYVLSLVVNDGQVNSIADTVTVRAGTPVPDTGQTRWYSTAFGDDGDYTINPMSYTDNFDGTITDNVTGLTWQKCSMGQSGADCATGAAATYNWYQASGTTEATYNPGGATNVCGSLSLAGTGWRLPTDFELMTIVDYGRYIPAIDTAYFPATVSSLYWSSTTYARSTSYAWLVDFGYGYSYDYNKTFSNYVRCVRGQ